MTEVRTPRSLGPAHGLVLGLAAGLLSACGLFEISTAAPEIASLSPEEGRPGTEVTIVGSNLGNPLSDGAARLRFGSRDIVAQNEDPNLGVVLEWGPQLIRFMTPIEDTAEGPREVVVVTGNGRSNPAVFTIIGTGVVESFTDFVGAVIGNDDEAVVFARFHKAIENDPACVDLDLVCDATPELELRQIDGDNFLTYSFALSGYESRAADVRVAKVPGKFDGAILAVERRPETAGQDGLAELLVLDAAYGGLVTAQGIAARPQRFVSRDLGSNSQEALLMSGVSGAMDRFAGSAFNPVGAELNLLFYGPDVRPDAGFFYDDNTLVVAAHQALDEGGDTFVVWIDQAAGAAFTLESLTVPAARAADVAMQAFETYDEATSTYSYTEDYYLAYNPHDAAEPSGLRRYRTHYWQNEATEGVTEATSTMLFPVGTRINAMALDTVSEVDEQLDITDATRRGYVWVPRLWLALDAGEETADRDGVLGLLLPGVAGRGNEFPAIDGATVSYDEWSVEVAAAAYTALTEAAAAASGATTAEPAAPAALPITPYTMIHDGDGEAAIDNPVALTLLPQGGELGPTFLLVSNAGRDSLAIIRADVPPVEGRLYAERALPVSGLGRLYCTERRGN